MSVWIADDAVVFGDVEFGDDCSVFYHSVIRVEDGKFVFGRGTNIQENCIIHGGGDHPVIVGCFHHARLHPARLHHRR